MAVASLITQFPLNSTGKANNDRTGFERNDLTEAGIFAISESLEGGGKW